MFSLGVFKHVSFLFSSQENLLRETKKTRWEEHKCWGRKGNLWKEMSENQDNDLCGMYNQIDEWNNTYFYNTLKVQCLISNLMFYINLFISFYIKHQTFFSFCSMKKFNYNKMSKKENRLSEPHVLYKRKKKTLKLSKRDCIVENK